MKISIVEPTPLLLAPDDRIRRDRTRPVELQDPSYAEKYDDRTLFYDAIPSGKKLILPGPPLLNLKQLIDTRYFTLNGHHPTQIVTQTLERAQYTELIFSDPVPPGARLQLSTPLTQTIDVQVQSNTNDALNDAKVLMTMQKDEELDWIQDWITYYSKLHSCDSVLIFDNNSTKYGVDDIAEAIQSNSQIETAIIVKWPFKYGPQGGAWVGTQAQWDSDFCQIGAFQTARYRFLSNVAGMINADIDELLVPLSHMTVFDALDESPQGVVGYGGHWISSLPITSEPGTPPRFVDYGFTGGRDDTCKMKWSGQPSKWPTDAHPTAHYVRNIDHLPSADFYIAHFRALNSGWKSTDRLKTTNNDDNLRLDLNLINSLNRAFPNSGISKLISSADINQTNDNRAYQFQNWIRSELTDLTTPNAQWNKKWLWKNTVPVFEGHTSIGQVAFDCHISERDIKLAVSVRDKQALPDLDLALKRLSVRIDEFRPKHLGFWTSKAFYNKKRDETWDRAAEHISSQMLLIWNELSGSDHYDYTAESPHPIDSLEKWPLRNLRDSAEFSGSS